MALVPPDLVSQYYQLNKPEIRIEDNISKILHEEETPDDVKAKLSHWIPKYQRAMQPPPQKPFVIPKELLQTHALHEEISSPVPSRMNMIAKYIAYTVPKTRKNIFYPFWKGSESNYTLNELEKDGKTEYRSNGIDLFSYLMRNERADRKPPVGFNTFMQGILATNISIQWIGNKYVKDRLILSQLDPKLSELSSPRTSASKPKKRTTSEKSRTLSSRESSPHMSETQPLKWRNWKD
ncbi:uncharacterized protein CDAR_270401 [Caerostris darwini]|uniref:Uncharacterized protein n=1 Tax=Caerostris darwini TaxID=1538125 RepID=A0AAV4NL78_9ARAC|nr:uncharacterized protein CDAR_270401 [Caerostris darwini]